MIVELLNCVAPSPNTVCVCRMSSLRAATVCLLCRCADLGVSLHTSTSGLDLPMKVLDMFGSAVPVCAFRFPSLSELVQDGRNGLSFQDSDQLAQQLLRLLVRPDPHFRSDSPAVEVAESAGTDCALRELQHLKAGASQISCWEDNWNSVMLPMVDEIFA